jgi:anthranilate phosphoribosyltransferase
MFFETKSTNLRRSLTMGKETDAFFKRILKDRIYQNIPLGYDDAYELGALTVAACRDDADPALRFQTIAALTAMHNKATYAHAGDGKETPKSAADQIAGICAAVFMEDIAKSESGFIRPNTNFVMDNCGMGGDLVVTANVSTLAALIAARAGIPMCKHGSPANADAGRHGSSDFIELCGIDPFMTRKQIERSVEQNHFAYSEALDTRFKQIHLQTHLFARVPHMNDLIGPITNPADPKRMTRRVLGVNHLVSPQVVAEAYRIMNQKGVTNMERMFVVRGRIDQASVRGFDELSLCRGGNEVYLLEDNVVVPYMIGAETFELPFAQPHRITPPDGVSKGQFSNRILYGEETGPARDMVIANAALLFMLTRPGYMNHRGAFAEAKEILDSGTVPRVVEAVRDIAPLKKAA